MNSNDILIEQIVGSVMQQLHSRSELPTENQQEVQPNSSNGQENKNEHHVTFIENVITAELLEKNLNGHRVVTLGAKSVLTPSAIDFLKSQHIHWTRSTNNDSPNTTTRNWKAIIIHPTSALTQAMDELQRYSTAKWQQELTGCAKEATAAAVSTLCRAEASGVAVFGNQPQAVACRANRNSRVRAAAIFDMAGLKKVQQELGANLICIDPAERTVFELRNLLRQAAEGASTEPPADWDG